MSLVKEDDLVYRLHKRAEIRKQITTRKSVQNNEPVAWMHKPSGTVFNEIIACVEPDDLIPLYTHPAKELHLSLQKSKETGELLAVTYTDDEHRIVEVLWQKPPAKTLTDFEIRGVMALDECWVGEDCSIPNMIAFARAILRKAQEK